MKKSRKPKRGKRKSQALATPEPNGRVLGPSEIFGDGWPWNENEEATQAAAGVLIAPEEWNFSDVPDDELEACACYEFARESETLLQLSEIYRESMRSGSEEDIAATHCDILEIHHQCGFLLESLAPHFDLRRATWENIQPEEIRMAAAKAYRGRPAFDTAKREGVYKMVMEDRLAKGRGVKEWDGVNLLFRSEAELALVHIDWTRSVAAIKRDCEAWLKEKIKQRGGRNVTGRHAKPERKALDLLNGLGALRLLAHYPMNEAIEITKKKLGRPLYAGVTAWKNGINLAVRHFRQAFPFDSRGMRSWNLHQDEKRK